MIGIGATIGYNSRYLLLIKSTSTDLQGSIRVLTKVLKYSVFFHFQCHKMTYFLHSLNFEDLKQGAHAGLIRS